MPAKLDRCVKKIKKQGRSESAAYGICNAALKKMKAKGKKKKYG